MEHLENERRDLECPVCLEYMIHEISVCQGGHSICLRCKTALKPMQCPLCKKKYNRGRNITLEKVASTLQFPCRNEGCSKEFSGVDITEHEKKTCEFLDIHCPLYFIPCKWIGSQTSIKSHMLEAHAACLDKWTFYKNINVNSEITDLNLIVKTFDDNMFIVCEESQSYSKRYVGKHLCAMILAPYEIAKKYILQVDLEEGDKTKMAGIVPCKPRCDLEELVYNNSMLCVSTHKDSGSILKPIIKFSGMMNDINGNEQASGKQPARNVKKPRISIKSK